LGLLPLVIGYFLLIRERPLAAGLVWSLLTLKPQYFFAAAFVSLVCALAGRYKTFLAMSLGTIFLVGLTVVIFSPSVTLQWLLSHKVSDAYFFEGLQGIPSHLITGLPANPTIAAHIDVGIGVPRCGLGEICGGLRSLAISPDGDTALVSSDASDLQSDSRPASTLYLIRNLRAFVASKKASDLRIRSFSATDYPQLDNVSGIAFGPGGRWAVVNTIGPGAIDRWTRTNVSTINGSYMLPRRSRRIWIASSSVSLGR